MSESKKNGEFNSWLNEIYDISKITDDEINDIYDQVKYQGFNREDTLLELFSLIKHKTDITKIVIACALRGPVKAAELKILDGKTLQQAGIPKSRKPGEAGLSCGRITSATADLAAYFLRRLNVPKRVNCDCPAWLQFPSAASIQMPLNLRSQHINFSKQFSTIIGGKFDETIYSSQVANAYLSENLDLFDEYDVHSQSD